VSLPDVVSREQWLEARRQLLAAEKDLLRKRDVMNADRRRLPMVRISKDYRFEGPAGDRGLAELFDGKRQLIIQHVMFGPDWEQPCPSCSAAINGMAPSLFENLRSRETNFVLASRAPYARIAEASAARGWDVPWYSSFGSDFNFDYEVSVDSANPATARYNYRAEPDLLGADAPSELPGFSCFLRDGDDMFHTYSTFARGTEYIGNPYTLLDLTALGRQEAWEEPKGRVETGRDGDPSFTS
jgi:predicted dithiol-disulfide oxidoreductase (DUF899 family)